MSNKNYFVVFYNSERIDYIEQITRYIQDENLNIHHPENTISKETGQSNIFFLEDTTNQLDENDISNFYRDILIQKNGSIQGILNHNFYVKKINSISPII